MRELERWGHRCAPRTAVIERSLVRCPVGAGAFAPSQHCCAQSHSWRLPLQPRATSWSTASPPSRRSEEHTSELQSHLNLVCRLLLEKKKKTSTNAMTSCDTT